jgi:hypothetical protein
VLEALRQRVGKSRPDNGLGDVYANFALSLLGDPTRFSLTETLNAVGDLRESAAADKAHIVCVDSYRDI